MFKTRGHQILNFCDLKTRELICCNAKGHNEGVWFIYFYTLDSELAILEVFGSWRRTDELVPLAGRNWWNNSAVAALSRFAGRRKSTV